MPTKFVEGATLRELMTGKKKLVTLYYDYFITTRAIRRAQDLINKGTPLKCDRDKARRQIARRRRLTVLAKVSRRRNR